MSANNRSKQKPVKKARSMNIVLLLLFAFSIGYWCANHDGLAYLQGRIKAMFAGNNTSKKPDDKQKNLAQKEALPKPKFEFYTLLTHEQTNTPEIVEAKPDSQGILDQKSALNTQSVERQASKIKPKETPTSQATKPAKAANTAYLLQIASFKRRNDAERLKADLLLKGFEARIVEFSKANTRWHRVVVGPFASRVQAEKMQVAIARSERMMGMILQTEA